MKIRVTVNFTVDIPESELVNTNEKVKLAKKLAGDAVMNRLRNAGIETNFEVIDTTLPRKDK
ncbi:MAG TPA: hypothetical protein VK203_27790 [Nostocaceae cyanobacterium]|nr:hypothetical protein [Nostocaceae cyanobacterium]